MPGSLLRDVSNPRLDGMLFIEGQSGEMNHAKPTCRLAHPLVLYKPHDPHGCSSKSNTTTLHDFRVIPKS